MKIIRLQLSIIFRLLVRVGGLYLNKWHAINTLLIQELSDWEKFDAALISLSSDEATVVNRVSSLEHLSDEQYLIEVVVSAVSGQANFGVEISLEEFCGDIRQSLSHTYRDDAQKSHSGAR